MADQQNFAEDVKPYLSELRHAAYRLAHTQMDTEDVLQESLAKAYKNYSTFREGTNLRAWLHRIVYNTGIDHYHRKARDVSVLGFTAFPEKPSSGWETATLEAVAAEESAEQKALTALELESALTKIKELPIPYQETIILADIVGCSYKEIASDLNIPIGTVMSRLHRARRIIRSRVR